MTNTDVENILSSDAVYSVLNRNPKLEVCTLKRGNAWKNSKVMATLNPFLAQDKTVREKKNVEWRKSLDGKLKKLEGLKQKRIQGLWKEIEAL